MSDFDGRSSPIQLGGGYSLQAPGLMGTITEWNAEENATRASSGFHEAHVLQAMQQSDIVVSKVFEVEVKRDALLMSDVVEDGSATRADGLMATTRHGEPAIVMTMPSLGENVDYAMLYTDEAGASRWLFPQATRGAQGESVWHLPRKGARPPASEEGVLRGPIGLIGRRLVRLVAWATDGLVGKTALQIVQTWEEQNRPYRFNVVRAGQPQPFALNDQPIHWEAMDGQRALLWLHGTFSTSQDSFCQLDPQTIATLAPHYPGGIFAFNHPSLHHSPDDNIQRFYAMLPPHISLQLDLVTHSRGGLVGRVLTERFRRMEGRRTRIGRAIFVAGPNQGTVLVNSDNAIELLDRYTNLLTLLPDTVFTLTLEAILTVVKLIGRGVLKGLPGLNCLNPPQTEDGEYLRTLNAAWLRRKTTAKLPPRYYAMTSRFDLQRSEKFKSLSKRIGDHLLDAIFGEDNDAVVPTLGCYALDNERPDAFIQASRRIVYDETAQIDHINYFSRREVNEQLAKWLIER